MPGPGWAPGAAGLGSYSDRGCGGADVDDSQVLVVVRGALGEVVGLAEDLGEDLAEGAAEIPDPVGVDDGVDDGVGVGQDDGHVHHPLGLGSGEVLVEVRDAVQDVQGQPAEGKKPHDDGQRLGCMHLFLQGGPGVAHQLDLVQLLAGHHEYLDVDPQHDDEREQHAAKEVEVDHVAHGHHVLKEARDEAALGLCPCLVGGVGTATHGFVPAHQGGQSNPKGQEPQHCNESSGPLAGHQAVVPAAPGTKPQQMLRERALVSSLQFKSSVFWLMRQKPRPRGGLTSLIIPGAKTLTCALHPPTHCDLGGDSFTIPERRQALPQPTNPLQGEGKDLES